MQPEKGVTIKANGINRFGGKVSTDITKNGSSINYISEINNKDIHRIRNNFDEIDQLKLQQDNVIVDKENRTSLPPINKKKSSSTQSQHQANLTDTKHSQQFVFNEYKPKHRDTAIRIDSHKLNKVFNEEDDDNTDNYEVNKKVSDEKFQNHNYGSNNQLFKIKTDKEEYEEAFLKEINEFNANLINNANWGSGSITNIHSSNNGIRLPLKPTKKKMERELGNRLKIKIIRSKHNEHKNAKIKEV